MRAPTEPQEESQKWTSRISVTGPAGVIVMLAAMLIILIAEPVMGWILLPSAVLGVLVAVILHSSKSPEAKAEEPDRAEIQISKIPVSGITGLVFTIGMMALFFAALPQVRLFLLLALPTGMVIGLGLYLWHKRHPLS